MPHVCCKISRARLYFEFLDGGRSVREHVEAEKTRRQPERLTTQLSGAGAGGA